MGFDSPASIAPSAGRLAPFLLDTPETRSPRMKSFDAVWGCSTSQN
jgi:hypothetical protein